MNTKLRVSCSCVLATCEEFYLCSLYFIFKSDERVKRQLISSIGQVWDVFDKMLCLCEIGTRDDTVIEIKMKTSVFHSTFCSKPNTPNRQLLLLFLPSVLYCSGS